MLYLSLNKPVKPRVYLVAFSDYKSASISIYINLPLIQATAAGAFFFLVIIIPLLFFRYFLDLRVYVTIYVVELKKQLQIWGNLTE